MSITFPAAHSAKLHSSSVDVDWLFHFINDNAGVVYLSSKDRTVSSHRYYGIVEDSGQITKEIDLINCTSSVSDISISCVDVYKGSTLSAELLHNGTDHYINQQVLIYECLNDETTLTNCALFYEGRLKEIDIQENSVTLMIEEWTPFDHIVIPNVKSTLNGVFQPVIYGDYTGNSADAFPTNNQLRPCPRHYLTQNSAYYAVEVSPPDEKPQAWDALLQQYLPLTASQASASKNGIDSKSISVSVERDFYMRPDETDTVTTTMGEGGGAYEDVYDTDLDSGIDDTLTDNETKYLVLKVPQVRGVINYIDVYVKGYIDISSESGTSLARVDVSVNGGNTWNTGIKSRSTAGSDNDEYDNTGDISGDLTADEPIFNVDDDTGANCSDIRIRIVTATDDAISADFYIKDVYLDLHMGWKQEDKTSELESLDQIYMGANGYDADYTDGSGSVASEIHVIHRDIMDRFAGVDYDNDYMVNWIAASPGAYDLDAARDGWTARLWLLEPVLLKDVLRQLQFEGCFIFMLTPNSDGSGNAGGRYIWVQNTYSSGDVVQSFTEDDYTNFSIGHTDVYEIITKSVYDFDRSPVDDSYRQVDDYDNDTEQANWNLSNFHNERIGLDFLVGSKNATDAIYDGGTDDDTPNESIVLYRDNIQSEPKILVDFEILNKKKSNVEVGDIIQVSDSNVNPYGETWADIYFMIISEGRTKEGLSITAREVYIA